MPEGKQLALFAAILRMSLPRLNDMQGPPDTYQTGLKSICGMVDAVQRHAAEFELEKELAMRHDHENFLPIRSSISQPQGRKPWSRPVVTSTKLNDVEMAQALESPIGLFELGSRLRAAGRFS